MGKVIDAPRRPRPLALRVFAWARPGVYRRARDAVGRRDGQRRQRIRLRILRDAGHADAGAGEELKGAGLDYYNHNLDTSPEFYGEIITTRTYQDRLDTLQAVRDAGMNVCCGGIVGMGEIETIARAAATLATGQHPESVPINELVQVPGTPLHGLPELDPFDFVRTIARHGC